MLEEMNDNSRVVLSNNWYFQYENQFLPLLNKNDTKDNLNEFITHLLSDLDSQIKKYEKLNFYIIGQNVYQPQSIKTCTAVDLSKTFLKNFIDLNKCYTFKNLIGEDVELINKALQDFANSKSNVHFIDRNDAIIADKKEKTFLSVDKDKRPIYLDKHHYTISGSKLVGRFVMNQIDKNN